MGAPVGGPPVMGDKKIEGAPKGKAEQAPPPKQDKGKKQQDDED
jgi:hypothetical protein